eukprot:s1120_g15.t1
MDADEARQREPLRRHTSSRRQATASWNSSSASFFETAIRSSQKWTSCRRASCFYLSHSSPLLLTCGKGVGKKSLLYAAHLANAVNKTSFYTMLTAASPSKATMQHMIRPLRATARKWRCPRGQVSHRAWAGVVAGVAARHASRAGSRLRLQAALEPEMTETSAELESPDTEQD